MENASLNFAYRIILKLANMFYEHSKDIYKNTANKHEKLIIDLCINSHNRKKLY